MAGCLKIESPHTCLRLRTASRSNRCTSCSYFNSAPEPATGSIAGWGMIRKSGRRFSEKIMLKQKDSEHGERYVRSVEPRVIFWPSPMDCQNFA